MESSDAQTGSPAIALHEMLGGYMTTQLIFVAARLGLADHLGTEHRTATELAQFVDADAKTLYRFLRALTTLGLLEEDSNQRFSLTPTGDCLRTDSPTSLSALITWAQEVEVKMWGHLEECVKTGRSSFELAYGVGMFDYFGQNPSIEAQFNAAMTSFVSRNVSDIVGAYRFAPSHRIIDVGGGFGSLMAAILQANPGTTGVVFDLPGVVQGAIEALTTANLANRCEFVEGDFSESVPTGGDIYLLTSILHDWDDQRCLAILDSCRRAIAGSGKLLIAEMVIPPGTGPSFSKLFDMVMLVLTSGGRERTEAEFQSLLASAGFRLERVIPTKSTVCLIEATPIETEGST